MNIIKLGKFYTISPLTYDTVIKSKNCKLFKKQKV